VDFKNTVLIMTSNVGTKDVDKAGLGFQRDTHEASYEAVKDKLLGELKHAFNPEFLNRVDEVIVFRSLRKEEIRQIIEIMLVQVLARLKDRNITFEMSDTAKEFLIEQGWSPSFGARPLRRAIQKYVEDALAEELLKGHFAEGVHLVAEKANGDALTFTPQTPAALVP
jgi:ATP-dependent Clp protease ATP-binding subunit ClpC